MGPVRATSENILPELLIWNAVQDFQDPACISSHQKSCVQSGSSFHQVEEVSKFKYLESVLHQSGSSESNIRERIARASHAFGMLCKIFKNRSLSIATKRAVYKAVVLSTLLYGSETWTTKCSLTRILESFHNRCIRSILHVTHIQQRMQRITSLQLRERFGMHCLMEEEVME